MLATGDSRRVAWDKTSHEFPSLGGPGRARRPLGEVLLAQRAITQDQLDAALQNPVRGLRLGSQLVHQDEITPELLAIALAEQAHVDWESLDALALAPALMAQVPARIALHYGVLPLREEGALLVLASESSVDPVSLAALGRKLQRQVRYVLVPKGQVVVGLRHWYARHRSACERSLLDRVVAEADMTETESSSVWNVYVSLQLLLGEVLQSLGRIDAAALGAVLLRHERSNASLGSFLVSEGVISQAVLDEGLQLQEQHQGSVLTLLRHAGKLPAQFADFKKVHLA